jgi:hypothetical protein
MDFEECSICSCWILELHNIRKEQSRSSSSLPSKRTHDPITQVRSWEDPSSLCGDNGDNKLSTPVRNQISSTGSLTLYRLRPVLSNWDRLHILETFSWWLPWPFLVLRGQVLGPSRLRWSPLFERQVPRHGKIKPLVPVYSSTIFWKIIIL